MSTNYYDKLCDKLINLRQRKMLLAEYVYAKFWWVKNNESNSRKPLTNSYKIQSWIKIFNQAGVAALAIIQLGTCFSSCIRHGRVRAIFI